MRIRMISIVVLPLLLLGTAGPIQGDADGLPNLTGGWTMIAKVKVYGTDTGDRTERQKVPVALSISQKGQWVNANVTPFGQPSFSMTGRVGNGHFWVTGTTDDGHARVLVGHVKSKGRKLKGLLLEGWDDEVDEVKFTAKRSAIK